MRKSKIEKREKLASRRDAPGQARAVERVLAPRPKWSGLTWCTALFVFAATCAAFRPALDGGWLDWDDLPLLYENQAWRGFSAQHLGWMFTTFHMGPYQPLSWLSYAFDHALWGMDPRGYHLTNVGLHAASAVCLFFLARDLLTIAGASARTPRLWLEIGAGFTALSWSIHPLRVESVAWITERRDCLAGLFFLLALLAWLAHLKSDEPRVRRRWYRWAVSAFAASLLAKALAMVFPLVLLVLDAWPLERWTARDGADRGSGTLSRARALATEKWPFWILSLAAAALAVIGQHSAGAIVNASQHGALPRLAQAFYGLAFYVRKTLWPADLMVLHPIPVPLPFGEPRFVASEIAVVLAAAVLVLGRRRLPALLGAAASYVLIVAPVLGFLQTGSQLVAARYSYLASIPLTLLAGGGLLLAARKLSGPSTEDARVRSATVLGTSVLALGCALLVPLGLATAEGCRVWHDTFSLWEHDLAINPKDNAARKNLIVAYLDQGRAASDPKLRRSSLESALEQCRRGLEQGPDAAYYSNAAKVHDLLAEDEPAERARHLELALDEARRGINLVEHSNQRLPEIYEACGVILCKLDRPDEAVPCFEKLVAQDSTSADRYGMLAEALIQAGRAREALAALEAARRIAPEAAAVWLELGQAHQRLGQREAAVEAYRRVLELARRGPGAAPVREEDVALARQALQELGGGR